MDDRDHLDRLIDEGVRRYAQAEPPLGMENRVLAALQEKRQPAWWRRRWLIAMPALAALALVVGLAMQRRPAPNAPAAVSTNTPSQPAPMVGAPPLSRPMLARQGGTVPRVPRLPKLERFPAPEPPSQQEILLARLVNQGVRSAPVPVMEAKADNVEVEPVTISRIEIPLLPDPNSQGE